MGALSGFIIADRKFGMFSDASSASVVSTALAVLVGNFAGRYLEALPLKLIAGVGFLTIGAWTTTEHLRAA